MWGVKLYNVTLFLHGKGDRNIRAYLSTKEGFVYVIEGKGIFTLEGEGIHMAPGVIIFLEKNAVHSLKAEKNTAFMLALSS